MVPPETPGTASAAPIAMPLKKRVNVCLDSRIILRFSLKNNTIIPKVFDDFGLILERVSGGTLLEIVFPIS